MNKNWFSSVFIVIMFILMVQSIDAKNSVDPNYVDTILNSDTNLDLDSQRVIKIQKPMERPLSQPKSVPSGKVLNIPMPRDGCIQLYQSDFPNGQGMTINYPNGCVELMENVNLSTPIYLRGGEGGFYFSCNNNIIRGYAEPDSWGIVATESVTVRDCIVENNYIGFRAWGNSRILNSIAQNNLDFYTDGLGFDLSENASIESSEAISTEYIENAYRRGFVGRGNSIIRNSLAHGNELGFILIGNSHVENSNAVYSRFTGFSFNDQSTGSGVAAWATGLNGGFGNGFDLNGNSVVTDAISRNNHGWGFDLYNNGTVINGLASYNSEDGFRLTDSSMVQDSESTSNTYYGYWMFGNSKVENSLGKDNVEMGFDLNDFSECHYCTARGNGGLGSFYLEDNTIAQNSQAISNLNYGFYLTDQSKAISSTATTNARGGFFLRYSTINGYPGLIDGISRYNGQSPYDYGIKSIGAVQIINVLSDNNKNGIFVDNGGRLLDGYRSCGNDNYNIFVNGGYVEGRFVTGPISGAGNWQNAVIVPCGGGGSSPLYLKAERTVYGQSPQSTSWVALIVAAVALLIVFLIYRNFSAMRQNQSRRINKDRINTRRRP